MTSFRHNGSLSCNHVINDLQSACVVTD